MNNSFSDQGQFSQIRCSYFLQNMAIENFLFFLPLTSFPLFFSYRFSHHLFSRSTMHQPLSFNNQIHLISPVLACLKELIHMFLAIYYWKRNIRAKKNLFTFEDNKKWGSKTSSGWDH